MLKKKDEAYTLRHILRDIGAEHVLTKPQNVPIFNESFQMEISEVKLYTNFSICWTKFVEKER